MPKSICDSQVPTLGYSSGKMANETSANATMTTRARRDARIAALKMAKMTAPPAMAENAAATTASTATSTG